MGKIKNLIKELNDQIEEAKKLTTKQRKKMKSSTFCGPNRSFPVPDCEHVRVAKAYLGRSKYSASSKKRIAACINRKAKSLGCKVTKKAKAASDTVVFDDLTSKEQELFYSDVFESTNDSVERSIGNPGLDLDFEAEN